MSTSRPDFQAIRQRMVAQRKSQSALTVTRLSEQIIAHVLNFEPFVQARCIGGYFPFNGEVDARPLISWALMNQKNWVLPKVRTSPSREMDFLSVHSKTEYVQNRFKIFEPHPQGSDSVAPSVIDWVLVPLVAFDRLGHRLGMGMGYYDTTFAFKSKHQPPFWLGLAYGFQQIENFSPLAHDIPLDAVATENGILEF